MPKKKPIKGKPKVHEELEGLEIMINEFGEITGNFNIDNINEFLNEKTKDKKLKDRRDNKKDEPKQSKKKRKSKKKK